MVEVPDRAPGPGEVAITVRAAAVNPTDLLLRSGARPERLANYRPPYVPGMDAAGVLDELGPGVKTKLEVGEQVMAIVVPRGSRGAYSERLIVPMDSVAAAPAAKSAAEASTLPMNGLTVILAFHTLGLRPGQLLAITGAAGTLGGYAIQLGKAEGYRIVADASPEDEDLVYRLGADVVVPRGPGFAEQVRRAFRNGADGLLDGAALNQEVAGAVRDGGRVATVRGFRGESERGVTFHPVWVFEYAHEGQQLDRLARLVADGSIDLRVAGTLPAARAAEAHRRLEAGGLRGRLVLEF